MPSSARRWRIGAPAGTRQPDPPLRPRRTIWLRRVYRQTGGAPHPAEHEPGRQPLRQRPALRSGSRARRCAPRGSLLWTTWMTHPYRNQLSPFSVLSRRVCSTLLGREILVSPPFGRSPAEPKSLISLAMPRKWRAAELQRNLLGNCSGIAGDFPSSRRILYRVERICDPKPPFDDDTILHVFRP
jgi:hypothetical protein